MWMVHVLSFRICCACAILRTIQVVKVELGLVLLLRLHSRSNFSGSAPLSSMYNIIIVALCTIL